MSRAAYAEGRAGRDQDVRPLQQGLAELLFVQSGFLDAGEEIEGALGADEAEVGDPFDPVGGVKKRSRYSEIYFSRIVLRMESAWIAARWEIEGAV